MGDNFNSFFEDKKNWRKNKKTFQKPIDKSNRLLYIIKAVENRHYAGVVQW